jgi:hypothetical protein
MNKIIEDLALENKKESKLALKYTIRRLYLALICYTISSILFESPVLSFYTILSRKVDRKDRELWEKPENFNSYLSTLT